MIPDHLSALPWYLGHLAWLRSLGHHAPGPDVSPVRAVLRGANLRGANLRDAVLRDADLRDAVLRGAVLRGATLPDGRTLEQWRADPLAGLCTEPDAVARAVAAWGGRTWQDCPLHAGLGVDGLDGVPEDRRALAATFVALLDGSHLPRPVTP